MPALNSTSRDAVHSYTHDDYQLALHHNRSPSPAEGGTRLSEEVSGVSNAHRDGVGAIPSASMSAARTVTAPNASTEEIEMSMKAFARDLIGDFGGARALDANRQLTLLLEGTKSNSDTQRNLRKFMYALHTLNVPSIYDSKDPAHLSKRKAAVNAFIDAIDAAAKHHIEQPAKSDEVLSAKLDLNSKTGKASYKLFSKAWEALSNALSQRSTAASDIHHLQEYYAQHVVPRIQLRAQFLCGGDIDNPEALIHSGSKQGVEDAVRDLLCGKAVNPEETGLHLASACQLLHMMPEFLRRPKPNQDATEPAKSHAPENQGAQAHPERPGEVPAYRNDSAPGHVAEHGALGRELWNVNCNGDQTMIGPEIKMFQAPDTNRHAGASTSEQTQSSPRPEPASASRSDAAVNSAGDNTGTDGTQLVGHGHRSRRGPLTAGVLAELDRTDQLATSPPEHERTFQSTAQRSRSNSLDSSNSSKSSVLIPADQLSSSGSVSPRPEPASASRSDAAVNSAGDNTGTDGTQLVGHGHRSRRGSLTAAVLAGLDRTDQLATSPPEHERTFQSTAQRSRSNLLDSSNSSKSSVLSPADQLSSSESVSPRTPSSPLNGPTSASPTDQSHAVIGNRPQKPSSSFNDQVQKSSPADQGRLPMDGMPPSSGYVSPSGPPWHVHIPAPIVTTWSAGRNDPSRVARQRISSTPGKVE